MTEDELKAWRFRAPIIDKGIPVRALIDEVLRLKDELDNAPDWGHVEAIKADNTRLRELIKSQETQRHEDGSGNHEFMCPWCGVERPSSGDSFKGPQPHSTHCEAFTMDGKVR